MLRWILEQWRQAFCQHTFDLVAKGPITEMGEPAGCYRTFFCTTCGVKKHVETR